MTNDNEKIPSSFRDPSGFLFRRNDLVYRQVNKAYKENYDYLISSGLYKILVKERLLIPHEEVVIEASQPDRAYKIIKPKLIPFISYPYEWCFSQLKRAALITLEIQKKSIEFGMSLKDSSAYNVQFIDGSPILIDTLSFEKYRNGQLWPAYRQYCQHFLAPLALMSYKDIRLNELFRIYLDGIPLDLASSLLPFRTRLNFSFLSHIHLHAGSQKHFAGKKVDIKKQKISRVSFLGLINNLYSATKKLYWQPEETEWADYYQNTNYSNEAFEHKKKLVGQFLDKINPTIVWDLGSNTGSFSRISSNKGFLTISFDSDHGAVEKNYLTSVRRHEKNHLPLLLDLSNPSPGIGWENRERMSLIERGPADAVLALALIHHLIISNNLPFNKIADFLNKICSNSLIIEWIPKNDSQVQRLLSTREDIFGDYDRSVFEKQFSLYFKIKDSVKIANSERVLYLMKK